MSTDQGVAHHGNPVLTQDAYDTCRAMITWIRTVRKERFGDPAYGEGWLPTDVDMQKSRLFWRCRSGKEPLLMAPPTAYSCPWYEVVEEMDRPHWAYDGCIQNTGTRKLAFIAQCPYEILELADDEKSAIVKFNMWKFRIFIGQQETRTYDPSTKTTHPSFVEGWFIQRIE